MMNETLTFNNRKNIIQYENYFVNSPRQKIPRAYLMSGDLSGIQTHVMDLFDENVIPLMKIVKQRYDIFMYSSY